MAPTLLTLPPEIRNTIFGLLLPSRSDRITVRRKILSVKFRAYALRYHERKDAKRQRISMALLRTCKQTSQEYAELLDWTQYEFSFHVFALVIYIDDYKRFPVLPFKHVRDIELQFDPYDDTLETAKCLKALTCWAEQGSLKTLTLKAFYMEHSFRHGHSRVLGQQVCGQWLRFRTQASPVGHNVTLGAGMLQLEMRLVLPKELEELMMTIYDSPLDIGFGKIAEEIHNLLGGELWVGDTLCWVDGTQVEGVPELNGK